MMIIQPKIRGFICPTAHPIGCAKVVDEQIAYVQSQFKTSLPSEHPSRQPKNVLIIGASTGYGLASWITTTFGNNAKGIGVFYERAADEKRTASPGWYNVAHFEKRAKETHHYAKSINGDAFSDEIKQQTADLIRRDLKQIDLIVYSVAAPRRTDPTTGQVYQSTLKPIGNNYTNKTVDAFRHEVKEVTLNAATEEEIANTVAVMGGDDWKRWITYLAQENLLAEGIITVNYSYIGPTLTHPIYKDGTIGQAKKHAKQTAENLNLKLAALKGQALISVNKAVVTQASAAIPVVPLYISLLFKIMKENHTHEGCIEQMVRLFKDYIYGDLQQVRDLEGNIRLDDLEMAASVQQTIAERWPLITTDNLDTLTDIAGYRDDFYRLFGFNLAGIDYNQDVNPAVDIESLKEPL